MHAAVDERGRVLIPQDVRERLGIVAGTMVELEERGKEVVLRPRARKRRLWGELRGLRPKRTGKPVWPTPAEIKGIWE